MIRIGKVIPERHSFTSFYRGEGPLQRLEKDYSGATFVKIDNKIPHWSELLNFDILFFYSPSTLRDRDYISYAKSMGAKIWVDYDDNLFALNKDHKLKAVFDNNKLFIEQILSEADIVTVSTKHLLETYIKFNKNTILLPNAIDLDLWREEPQKAKNKSVTWRGGEGHFNDLYEVKDQLIEVANAHPDWTFNFLGFNPLFLQSKMEYTHYPPTDIITYIDHLQALSSKIHICPLSDNPYSRSRSCNAWLEATYAGSIVIGPAFEEWQKRGLIRYRDKDDFKDNLIMAIAQYEMVEKGLDISWDYIKNNLSLSRMNKLRCEIILSLTGTVMRSQKR